MNKWISVNDRLPNRPDYDWVLISFVDAHNPKLRFVPSVAELRDGKWVSKENDSDIDRIFTGDFEKDFHVKITHWMDLPAPPKNLLEIS